MVRRRRASAKTRKGRATASRLRSLWRKRTRAGSKYSHLGATVRTHKNGTIRRGRRKHVKGYSWTGRKGTVALFSRKTGKKWGTNPKHRRAHGRRRNPAMSMVKDILVTPVVGLPRNLPAIFKGSIVKNVAFAAGGTVVALVGGNMLQKAVMPLLANIPGVSNAMGGGMVQRVVGASFAIVTGGVVGRFAIKDAGSRNAFVTGAAAAALVEAIFPGRVAGLLAQVPVIGQYIAPVASPVQGLAGLFGTDDLAGIGGYLVAPNYQGSTNGLGAYVKMGNNPGSMGGLGAYATVPDYQGSTNGLGVDSPVIAGLGYRGEQLAGLGNLDGMGSNMPSHLDS